LRTSNDASLGVVMTLCHYYFCGHFSCIFKVTHQDIQAESTQKWRFQVTGILEKSGPDLANRAPISRSTGRVLCISVADFMGSGADFEWPIYRKVRFWIKGSRFWRSKGIETHKERSRALLETILSKNHSWIVLVIFLLSLSLV
jgi:hypothetical protein